MVNSNHAGFEWRLNFARELLPNTFMFEIRHSEPIGYKVNFPFPYNNFVYVATNF